MGWWADIYRQALPSPAEARLIRALGRVSGHLLVKKQAQIRDNIRLAFPEELTVVRLLCVLFSAHFANQYISFSIPKIKPFNAHRYLRWEGIEKIPHCRKGLVLAHPHMGPAQLPLHCLGLRFPSVHQIGGGEIHLVPSKIGQWASERRGQLEHNIAATLHDGKTYLRPALRALKAGGIVLSACDATGGGKKSVGVSLQRFWGSHFHCQLDMCGLRGRRRKFPCFQCSVRETPRNGHSIWRALETPLLLMG